MKTLLCVIGTSVLGIQAGTWEAWAKEHAFAIEATADARVLLLHEKKRSASRQLRAIAKGVKAFDELIGPREGETETAAVVLIELPDAQALAELNTSLNAQYAHLAGWKAGGYGFVLEQPLIGAWLAKAPELKEWKAENELVNRLTQLLLIERHGRLPQWLALGLAWQLESTVCKSVYCFPYRSGFVSKAEHKGWAKELAAMIAARGEQPLTMEQLDGWTRGVWDDAHAALAWGAGAMLADEYDEELPRVLAALAALRDSEGRTTHADGSWEGIPNYEIPPEKQLAILDRELGVDFLAELARFCRMGRNYRRPR